LSSKLSFSSTFRFKPKPVMPTTHCGNFATEWQLTARENLLTREWQTYPSQSTSHRELSVLQAEFGLIAIHRISQLFLRSSRSHSAEIRGFSQQISGCAAVVFTQCPGIIPSIKKANDSVFLGPNPSLSHTSCYPWSGVL
jgi:hypothetical protein